MKFLDEMPLNDVIELFYEKHAAVRQGDMKKLLELKNKCPEIFDKEKDKQIRDMIDYYKAFQNSDRYKELQRIEMRKKISIVSEEKI